MLSVGLCFLPILAPSLGGNILLHILSTLRDAYGKKKISEWTSGNNPSVAFSQDRGSETSLFFNNSLNSWQRRQTQLGSKAYVIWTVLIQAATFGGRKRKEEIEEKRMPGNDLYLLPVNPQAILFTSEDEEASEGERRGICLSPTAETGMGLWF